MLCKSVQILFLTRYICELGLGVYSLAHIAPSKLSASALALAMRLVEPSASFTSLWSPALVHYTKYKAEDLGAVITPLAEVLFLAPSAKLGTVYSKFCNKKFMKISRIPLLDDPILRKIAKGEVSQTIKKMIFISEDFNVLCFYRWSRRSCSEYWKKTSGEIAQAQMIHIAIT